MAANKKARPRRKKQTASVPAPNKFPPDGRKFQARWSDIRDWAQKWMPAALALGLLVGAAYYPATQADFIWDDFILVTARVVREASGIWEIWFSPYPIPEEVNYWPLLYSTFWLEHKIWGFNPLGFRLVNLALHFANVVLVWTLLRKLAIPGAWLAAALFAVHPTHVEPVAWIIGRKDLLSTFFILAAMLAWLRFTQNPTLTRYLWPLLLFVAGMLTKTTAVILPAALLVVHWWERGRITSTDLHRLAPLFVLGLVWSVVNTLYSFERAIIPFDHSIPERILIAAHSLWFYVTSLLWPTKLAIIYPHWDIGVTDLRAWGYVAAVLAAALALWLLRKQTGRGPAAAMMFFVVALAPVLGFVDFSWMTYSFVADRYQYLASGALLAAIAGGAVHASARLPRAARTGTAVLAGCVLVLLGVLSWKQTEIYRDNMTYLNHITAFNPQAPALGISQALGKAGRYEEAIAVGLIAAEQAPDKPAEQTFLGVLYYKLGQFEEAEKYHRRALEIQPSDHEARQNLAENFRRQGNCVDALPLYEAALKSRPDYFLAHAGKGTCLFNMERYEEAIRDMERALELGMPLSQQLSLRLLLGSSETKLGHPEAAIRHYERGFEINPRHPPLLLTLGQIRFDQGHYEEALSLYRILVEIEPENGQAHAHLGSVFDNLGQKRAALKSFERAVELRPDEEKFRKTLDRLRTETAESDG